MFRKIYKFVKVSKDVIDTASAIVEHIITTTKHSIKKSREK